MCLPQACLQRGGRRVPHQVEAELVGSGMELMEVEDRRVQRPGVKGHSLSLSRLKGRH